MPSFTVNKAEFKKKFDGKKGGTFAVYTVELKDEQGFTNAELVQKEETPAPKPGDVLEGSLESTEYGMKFKKEQSFSGKGGGGKSPKERAEIRRMASQKCALELLRIETDIAIAMKDEHSEKLFAKLREEGGLSGHIEARTSFFESHAKAAEA